MKPQLFQSGQQALEELEKSHLKANLYTLAVIDIRMPGMDGFTLVEKIKENPDLKNIKIIVMTSSGIRGDSARCRDLGVDAYLLKPIKKNDLLDSIITVLGKPAAHPPGVPTSPRCAGLVVAMDGIEDFASVDRHFLRSLDAEAHFVPTDLDDEDRDVIVDHDLLVLLAREHQHPVPPFD